MDKAMKILLVDDEMLSTFYITMQLKRLGLKVHTTVSTGEAAIACAVNEGPDLILMDINLAGKMSGIEAVRRIKERSDIPVIFITGYSDTEIMKQADELNPAAYLVKPVDTEALRRVLAGVAKLGDCRL